jgi:hypothetical protein
MTLTSPRAGAVKSWRVRSSWRSLEAHGLPPSRSRFNPRQAQPAADRHACQKAEAPVINNSAALASCFGAAEDQDCTTGDTEERRMSSTKEAPISGHIEARIAKIQQMTLEEITAFTSTMMTEIITEKVTPREARAIDRAVRKRLQAIEQALR